MYCSNCGKIISDDRNYCSGFGSPAERTALVYQSKSQRSLIIGSTLLGTVGLGTLFPIIRTMLEMHVDPTLFCIIVVAYLAALLYMFSVLMGHVSKRYSGIVTRSSDRTEADTYSPPASFRGVTTSQLHAAEPDVASVTESTTRTLDQVPVNRH